jgi:hypothetical protein
MHTPKPETAAALASLAAMTAQITTRACAEVLLRYGILRTVTVDDLTKAVKAEIRAVAAQALAEAQENFEAGLNEYASIQYVETMRKAGKRAADRVLLLAKEEV